MYVVVIGGGNVGYYLTKELLAAGHEVVLIEKDPPRARLIADELGSIVVPNDGCEGRYQAEAGMGRADVMAAVTGDDEDNLVACQVAKMKFNVPRVIAKINDPLRGEAYRAVGVETICRTIILGDALVVAAQEGAEATNGFVEPATAEPRRTAPHTSSAQEAKVQAAMDAAEDVTEDATIVQPGDGRDGGF